MNDMIKIIEITNEMFPGSIEIEVISNTGDPSEKYLNLQVQSKEEVSFLGQQRVKWHQRIAGLGEVGLSIIPIE